MPSTALSSHRGAAREVGSKTRTRARPVCAADSRQPNKCQCKNGIKDFHCPRGGALINLISHFVCNLSSWQDLIICQPLHVMLNRFKVIKGGRMPSPVVSLSKKEMSICYCSTPPRPAPPAPALHLVPFIAPELQTCLSSAGREGDGPLFSCHWHRWTTPAFFLYSH